MIISHRDYEEPKNAISKHNTIDVIFLTFKQNRIINIKRDPNIPTTIFETVLNRSCCFLFSGIFLTESADSAKRAWFFCRECHKNVKSELQIQTCPCKKNATRLLEHNGTRKFRQGKGNPLVDQVCLLFITTNIYMLTL